MSGGGWKDLFLACQNGNTEMVQYYIREGIDLDYQHPEYMTSALIESVRQNQLEIIKILLNNGANPNIREYYGTDTAITIAKSLKNKAAVRLLKSDQRQKFQVLQEPQKVLITGGNRGIGKATAEKILRLGHTVAIVTRTNNQGENVIKELKEKTGNGKIKYLTGDLSNIKNCLSLCKKIQVEFAEVNVIINNAGVWKVEKEINEDGLEVSFMVNYVAPYIISNELLSTLKRNKPSRIVNVNAGLFVKGDLDLEKTPYGIDFHQVKTYATSKLCNVLFTIDFAKEIQDSGVTINAVHPGIINTGLGDSPKLISRFIKLIKPLWKSVEHGAEAPSRLAIGSDVTNINGSYYFEMEEKAYPLKVKDSVLRDSLRKKTDAFIRSEVQ